MIPFIRKHLIDHWTDFDHGSRPEDLFFIKFPDRCIKDPNLTNISFMVKKVIANLEQPVMIVKTPRYPGRPEPRNALETEFRNLVYVHESLKTPEIKNAVPYPYFLAEINDSIAFSQSFLFGEPMSHTLFSGNLFERLQTNFRIASAWLKMFGHEFKEDRINIDADFINEYVENRINKYFTYSPKNSARLVGYFNLIRGGFKGREGREIPIYPQHYDFHASNIFLMDGKVSGVIDWEDFMPDGLPMFDIFHFIKTYVEGILDAVGNSDPLLVEKILSPELMNIAKTVINGYCLDNGIDPGLANAFLALYLIESQNLAADPSRKAFAAFNRGELIMTFENFNIEKLLLSLGIIPLNMAKERAALSGDAGLSKLCAESLQSILTKISNIRNP